MGVMNIILDPSEVAIEGRTELPLEGGGLSIYYEGLDFGDQEIKAYMAEGVFGSRPIDHDWPLRTIKIPLVIRPYGTETFDEIRVKLEAKIARINEDGGGWLKRILSSGRHIFADIVEAKLHLSAGWLAENRNIDREATLELQALPDFYGDRIDLPAFEGIGDASETFQIEGSLPSRVDLTISDKSGHDQLGVSPHFRCRNVSSAESANWAYEAEDLTPLDLASIGTLSEASPSGSTANNVVTHPNLGTIWTPVLGTNRPPKVRGVGAASASTGKVTPALPTGVRENDILVMFIETENQAVTVPTGWALVSGSPIEVSSGTLTRLTVLWRRAGATEVAPTIEDPGDHVIARIMAVSGCIKTGSPWDVKATGTELVSDTSVEIPGATTSVDGCLVIAAFATGTDVSSSAQASGWTNVNLQALTERMDSWTAEGGGGGFGVATGIKMLAGSYGATTATVGTANFKALMSFALKPETGGNFLTHVGLYDVWARVYTSSEEPPWLRLIHDLGDLVAPSENSQIQIPGPNSFYLVDLGQVNIKKASFGEHRWQGTIQARGALGGENVSVDRLWFKCGDEYSGSLNGASGITAPVSSTFLVRDEFNQSGEATGKSAPAGGVYEAAAKSDTTDFIIASGKLTRNATSDSGTMTSALRGRGIGVPVELTDLVMRNAFNIGSTHEAIYFGHMMSYTAPENFVAALLVYYAKSPQRWQLQFYAPNLINPVFPLPTYLPSTGPISGELISVICGNLLTVYLANASGAVKQIGQVSNSKVGAKGKCFLFDMNDAGASLREYDNLAIWSFQNDAAIYANQDALVSTSGIWRRSEDGLAYGPIAYPGSDVPRIPVSGQEVRPVEVAVKMSRGDFKNMPDSGLDKFSVQLSYWPCWSQVPKG